MLNLSSWAWGKEQGKIAEILEKSGNLLRGKKWEPWKKIIRLEIKRLFRRIQLKFDN